MSEDNDEAASVPPADVPAMDGAAADVAVTDVTPQELALPGRFLREAREARNMTVAEVAHSLKFGVRQIEAIEADDFAALPPGATFVRGFVRGYAKLLRLDPDRLLAMLDLRAPAALPDVREPQNMGVAATPVAAGRRSSRPMVVGSAALAAVALALAVWHFLSQPGEAPKPVAAPEIAPPPADAVRAPDIRVEPAPVAPAEPAAAVALLPADAHRLVFTFGEKSWVEVKDATQRIVFSGENPAGSRQVVAGKPPFQVVIGNAVGVEVQYDERQIDLKPHIRAEVARLTIE